MGLLADIGRSQAIPQMTQTFMGLADLASRKRLETQNLELMNLKRQEAEREQRKFDIEQKNREEGEELKTMKPLYSKYPYSADFIIGKFEASGFVERQGDNEPLIRRKYQPDVLKVFQDPETNYAISELEISGRNKDIDAKTAELQKLRIEKPDDKRIPVLQQEIDELEKGKLQWRNVRDSIEKFQRKGKEESSLEQQIPDELVVKAGYPSGTKMTWNQLKSLEPKEKKYNEVTLYNIKNPNLTKRVSVEEGQTLIPEAGWTMRTPDKIDTGEGKLTPTLQSALYLQKTLGIKLKDALKMVKETDISYITAAANIASADPNYRRLKSVNEKIKYIQNVAKQLQNEGMVETPSPIPKPKLQY